MARQSRAADTDQTSGNFLEADHSDGQDREDSDAATKSSPVEKSYDEIIYCPGEGDPIRVRWNGLEFKAHIPTRVSKSQGVLVPMPTAVTLPDGTQQTRHVEKKVPMVELARKNPAFMVNGEKPAERKSATVRSPENADEYRGYAIRWIAGSTEASAMDVRWKAEEFLRDRCGCDDKDISYLMPFFEAKREECIISPSMVA